MAHRDQGWSSDLGWAKGAEICRTLPPRIRLPLPVGWSPPSVTGAVRLSLIADLKGPGECERSSRYFQPHQLRVAIDINFN
jgi:hypothetical protein